MANAMYLQRGTTITWLNSGGDEEMDLGLSGAQVAAGLTVGSYHDFGASPQPDAYLLEIDIDGFDTAPVVGESVKVYLTESQDSTLWTGPEAPSATVDGVGAINRLPNLRLIVEAVVHTTTAGDNLVNGRVFQSPARYIAPVIYNATADNLLSTADAHELRITPLYYELQ